MFKNFCATLALIMLCACGGRSDDEPVFRLSRVESRVGALLKVHDIHYLDDGRVREILEQTNDAGQGKASFEYGADQRVDHIVSEHMNASNSDVRLDYDGAGRVVQARIGDEDGLRLLVFTYDDLGLLVQRHMSFPEGTGQGLPQDFFYSYSPEARLIKVEWTYTALGPDDLPTSHVLVTRYEWDRDGRIVSVKHVLDGGEGQRYAYGYDEQGRLATVSMSPFLDRTVVWQVSYNADGLISGVVMSEGDSWYAYAYEKGAAKGLGFAPDVPFGQLFDLRGHIQPVDFLHATTGSFLRPYLL